MTGGVEDVGFSEKVARVCVRDLARLLDLPDRQAVDGLKESSL